MCGYPREVYTLGGLLGSLGANRLQDQLGRKGALRISGFFLAVGSGFMTIAAQYYILVIGRYAFQDMLSLYAC